MHVYTHTRAVSESSRFCKAGNVCGVETTTTRSTVHTHKEQGVQKCGQYAGKLLSLKGTDKFPSTLSFCIFRPPRMPRVRSSSRMPHYLLTSFLLSVEREERGERAHIPSLSPLSLIQNNINIAMALTELISCIWGEGGRLQPVRWPLLLQQQNPRLLRERFLNLACLIAQRLFPPELIYASQARGLIFLSTTRNLPRLRSLMARSVGQSVNACLACMHTCVERERPE